VASQTVQLKLKISFPMILIMVGLLHLLLILANGLSTNRVSKKISQNDDPPTRLQIRRVKTAKAEHPVISAMDSVMDAGGGKPRPPVSLRDLSLTSGTPPMPQTQTRPVQRPGTRPIVELNKPKAMNAISLRSKEFKDFSKSFPSGGLNLSNIISSAHKISDAVVSIEVPDGIDPDDLNEYELMFYGFQKRTSLNYINSILKNVDKFQKTHPHYRLPSSGKFTMTARITYDPAGNVQQIKMIRWTHVNELQTLFEDIVKSIDQLHNPPKALWEKNGEFSMFYTLEILNG
jgi:hypothetical protein